jgi:hypothetical protein
MRGFNAETAGSYDGLIFHSESPPVYPVGQYLLLEAFGFSDTKSAKQCPNIVAIIK